MSGVFISVDGVDGAGKTTQLNLLHNYLTDQGYPVLTTKEPGGTVLGEALRHILLRNDSPIAAEAELLLMCAARMQHLHEVLIPALAADQWVLCDRFIDATYAYQGAGRGIDLAKIAQLEGWVARHPDLTLWLEVATATSRHRCTEKATRDRFENENAAFTEQVQAGYRQRAQQFPHRITRIDANDSIAAVHQQIRQCVMTTFATLC